MIRRSFRIGLWLGLLGGIAFAVVKLLQSRQPAVEPAAARDLIPPSRTSSPPWERLEEPPPTAPAEPAQPLAPVNGNDEPVGPVAQEQAPPPRKASSKKAAAKKAAPKKSAAVKKTAASWVDPKGNVCPRTHPVKAKLSSRIFQLPGMFAYDRTNPDRCYRDADAATADGFRAAKR